MSSNICRRCHRRLKNPVAIQKGIGPVCEKKEGGQLSIVPEDPYTVMLPLCDPAVGDVVVRREAIHNSPSGSPRLIEYKVEVFKYFNIPHTIKRHSPTGMDWGYAGSGPADLALNILYHFYPSREFADRWHQDFKDACIVSLPKEGGIISGSFIHDWIRTKCVEETIAYVQSGGKIFSYEQKP